MKVNYEKIARYLKQETAQKIIANRGYSMREAIWLELCDHLDGDATEGTRISAYNAIAIRLGVDVERR